MPLGLLANIDIDALKKKTSTSPSNHLWSYLVSRWEGIAARVAEEGKFFDQGALGWHGITPMVVEAAVIYHLDNRKDALEYSLRCLQNLLDTYGDVSTAEGLSANFAGGKSMGGHLKRPKVLSHGEVALAAGLLRDNLPDILREKILTLMREVCIPFHDFQGGLAGYSSGGNIILCKNINAAICALVWGEECSYPDWQQVINNTCDNVRQYLRNGNDNDGFSYEGTGYGEQVMQFIFLFCHLLRGARWPDDLLRDEPRMRLIPDAYQHMILPSGSFAATTNDSGHRAPMSLWWLLLAAQEWNRPDYRGVWEHYSGPQHPIRPYGDSWPDWGRMSQTDPRTIEHADKTLLLTFLHWDAQAPFSSIEHSPLPTAVCAEGTGTGIFRTSWNRDAIFAAILGGGRSRACFGHGHADCGHIDIAIGGEYLAVDTGRYNSNEDQHSVVLIDGKNRFTSSTEGGGMGWDPTCGRLGEFQRHRMLDYCVADATNMKGAIWGLRNFLFIRTTGDEGYIVLLDNINADNGASCHEYWWQLHCATTAKIELTGEATATVKGQNARIDCAFFQKPDTPSAEGTCKIEVQQDIKEWVWPYGRNQDPAIVAQMERTGESISSIRRPRLLAKQKTYSCMLLTVLSPRRTSQENRTLRQIPVTNGIGIEVTGDGFTDTIYVAPDHKLILAEGIKCFSEFAVIRRNNHGEILDLWTQSGEQIQFI